MVAAKGEARGRAGQIQYLLAATPVVAGKKLRDVYNLAHWFIVLGPYPHFARTHILPVPTGGTAKGRIKKAPLRERGLNIKYS